MVPLVFGGRGLFMTGANLQASRYIPCFNSQPCNNHCKSRELPEIPKVAVINYMKTPKDSIA
jgi:hypothetical protein